MKLSVLFATALFLSAAPARAQDSFQIQVYQYITVPRGMWNLETHLNYTARGTTVPEGSVTPSEGQLHLSRADCKWI